jgi:hypothetical protein
MRCIKKECGKNKAASLSDYPGAEKTGFLRNTNQNDKGKKRFV